MILLFENLIVVWIILEMNFGWIFFGRIFIFFIVILLLIFLIGVIIWKYFFVFLRIILRGLLLIKINDVVLIIFLFCDKRKRVWLFVIFLDERYLKKNVIVFWVVFNLLGFSLLLFVWICSKIFVNVFVEIFLVVLKCLNSVKKLKSIFGIGIKCGVILYFFFKWRINFV